MTVYIVSIIVTLIIAFSCRGIPSFFLFSFCANLIHLSKTVQISLTLSLTDLIFLLFFFPLQNASCFINLSKTKSIVSNTFLCVYPPPSVCGQNQIFIQDLIPVRAPVAQFDTEQILGKCLLLLLRVS